MLTIIQVDEPATEARDAVQVYLNRRRRKHRQVGYGTMELAVSETITRNESRTSRGCLPGSGNMSAWVTTRTRG